MIAFPNAKINLGLFITEKRPDGFHNLETVFLPVKLSDALEIVPSERFEFHTSGLELEIDYKHNLVYKAYSLLKQDFDLPPVKIFLHKKIPFGAGLGGGSSDASFTLKLLNEIFDLQLTENQLLDYSKRLCSDCPFFILNRPAFATGKGDILEPINLDLSSYKIVIVKPHFSISTAEAYKNITPKKPPESLKSLIRHKLTEWRNLITNDFEQTLFEKYPLLREIKESLYEQGALFASLSGSGSAMFGIFSGNAEIDKRQFHNCQVFETKQLFEN